MILCGLLRFDNTWYPLFVYLSLQVVWRRTSQPHPITVGLDIYIPDDRYHVQHIPYRGSWNLMIKNVNVNDAGVYECQISAKERAGSRRLVLLNVLGKCVWSLVSLSVASFDLPAIRLLKVFLYLMSDVKWALKQQTIILFWEDLQIMSPSSFFEINDNVIDRYVQIYWLLYVLWFSKLNVMPSVCDVKKQCPYLNLRIFFYFEICYCILQVDLYWGEVSWGSGDT